MASREGEGASNKTGLKPRANRTKIAKEELCLKLLANAHLFCLNITWLYRGLLTLRHPLHQNKKIFGEQ